MEEKERLEKLEPAEALADRGEKTETIEAGSGEKDRRASIWTASCRWRP